MVEPGSFSYPMKDFIISCVEPSRFAASVLVTK
jgi:hypothetical protein